MMNHYRVEFKDLDREVTRYGELLTLDFDRESLSNRDISIIISELVNLSEIYNLWYIPARVIINNSDIHSFTFHFVSLYDTVEISVFRVSDGKKFSIRKWKKRDNSGFEFVRAW